MNSRKGRLLTWGSVVGGMVLLLVCAFAFKDRIAEEYWLWKLESGDVEEQKVAAEKLAEMGSVRAVPGFLRSCEAFPLVAEVALGGRNPTEMAVWARETDSGSFAVVSPIGQPLESCDDPYLEAPGRIIESRKLDCMGYLERAIEEEDQQVRRRAAVILIAFGSDAAPAIPVLEAALEEVHDEVIEYVVKELRKAVEATSAPLNEDKTGPLSHSRSAEEDTRT